MALESTLTLLFFHVPHIQHIQKSYYICLENIARIQPFLTSWSKTPASSAPSILLLVDANSLPRVCEIYTNPLFSLLSYLPGPSPTTPACSLCCSCPGLLALPCRRKVHSYIRFWPSQIPFSRTLMTNLFTSFKALLTCQIINKLYPDRLI